MLYKQSAIAVMAAVMLVAASLFGGLLTMPAFATHDSDVEEVAREQVTQEDGQSVIIDAIELNAKKLTSRTLGTVTIEIIQADDTLESASFETEALKTIFSTLEVDVTNINVTGSFEILIEYEGSSIVIVNGIDIVEGTDVAEAPDDTSNPDADPEPNQPEEPQVLENVIASRTISQNDNQSMIVEVIEFDVKKLTSRTRGTLTVALVQDDGILDQETFSTDSLKTIFAEMEATFDEAITGDFDVVFMYEGSGRVSVNAINVPAETEPAQNPPNNPPIGDTITLTVNAKDQTGNEVTGMWIEVYSGMSASNEPLFTGDTPESFELGPGDYIVAVADFENNIFQHWEDSTEDRTREATLTTDQTFTAIYSTDGSQQPQDPRTPPPSAGSGSIVVFAHRIPSPHWGQTFTSANAAMWYVLYNSTGWIIDSGFYDEEGTTITGLSDDQTYYVYATDCDECHEDPHDVVFTHWEDNSTTNPRAVTTGDSGHAYYRYEPDP